MADIRPLLSTLEALDVISRYLPREWSNLDNDQVTVQRLAGGYANTVNVVTRSTEAIFEPKQVLLHQVGGGGWAVKRGRGEAFSSRFEELLVFHESSKLAIAPKLYGASDDFTVQEYVHSRTLAPEDCLNKDILTKLAQAYAKFHSIDAPIDRTKYIADFSALKEKCTKFLETKEHLKHFAVQKFPELNWDEAFQVNFEYELNWINKMFDKVRTRRVIVTGDTNYLNVLIANEGDRIVLIDYEMAKFDHRGKDLGGHLINRILKWNDKVNKVSGHDILSKDLRRHFISQYCSESSKYLKDFDPSDLDSVDHVMEEAEVGILNYALTAGAVLLFGLEDLSKFEDGSFCKVTHFLLNLYLQWKDHLAKEHPHWN